MKTPPQPGHASQVTQTKYVSSLETSAQLFASAGVQKDMEDVAALEPEARLMLRVREGDDESFGVLLSQHRGPVISFLYRMVQNPAVSEELAQEVFLRVYRARSTYEPTAKFRTWLYRIATHVALNWIRDGKSEKGQQSLDVEVAGVVIEVPDRAPTAEQSLVREARMAEIRTAIQALPERQRAAVLLHKYEGLDYEQIGEALGMSESALKSLLFRAYETLRRRLAHLA
ncbi:MAG: RNA polymerase sigma factor [Bryobacteraceae bacterium]